MKQRHGFELWIILLVAMSLAVINCGDPKGSPVGSDFFGRELLDVVGPVSIPLQSAQAVQDTSQSNDDGSLLYVYMGDGTNHQVESVILFAPPDSGTTVQEATLKLVQDSVSVTGANVIAVYEWTQAWQDAIDAGTPLDVAPLGLKLADVSIETTEEDTLTISVDPAWVQSWTDTCGFILVSEISNLTAAFYSYNSSYYPTLNLLMDDDTTETVKYPVKDGFVVNRPESATETAPTIDNGTSQRIRLTFDVSAFAENITINRARLRLYLDPDVVTPLPGAAFNILAYPVTADSTEIPEYDSSTYASGVVSGDSVTIDIQSLCQNWTAGLTDNLGFLLIGAAEKLAITRRAIFVSGEENRKPTLEIFYTPSAVAPENP